jgi:hypothetical protein
MRRTKFISSSMRTHRRVIKTIRRQALLDRPQIAPGSWPNLCPAGLGRPGIEPPGLQ